MVSSTTPAKFINRRPQAPKLNHHHYCAFVFYPSKGRFSLLYNGRDQFFVDLGLQAWRESDK